MDIDAERKIRKAAKCAVQEGVSRSSFEQTAANWHDHYTDKTSHGEVYLAGNTFRCGGCGNPMPTNVVGSFTCPCGVGGITVEQVQITQCKERIMQGNRYIKEITKEDFDKMPPATQAKVLNNVEALRLGTPNQHWGGPEPEAQTFHPVTGTQSQKFPMLCDYERSVLSRIAFGNLPDEPGAAWWAACEALAGRGLINAGKVTTEGRSALMRPTQ